MARRYIRSPAVRASLDASRVFEMYVVAATTFLFGAGIALFGVLTDPTWFNTGSLIISLAVFTAAAGGLLAVHRFKRDLRGNPREHADRPIPDPLLLRSFFGVFFRNHQL